MEIGCRKKTEGSASSLLRGRTNRRIRGNCVFPGPPPVAIHFPPVTPYLLFPHLLLPPSVACNFKFHFPRLSRRREPLLTAFSRFSVPYLPFHDSTHPLTRPLFLSFRCRIAAIYLPVYAVRSGRFQEHACGQFQPFNDTSEKYLEAETQEENDNRRNHLAGVLTFSASARALEAVENFQATDARLSSCPSTEIMHRDVHNAFLGTK